MYGAFSWKVHGRVDTLFRDLDRGLRLWSWDLGKILIFSKCLTALDTLGIALSHLSVKFLQYKVTLSTKAKEEREVQFQERGARRVLLLTSGNGGYGQTLLNCSDSDLPRSC